MPIARNSLVRCKEKVHTLRMSWSEAYKRALLPGQLESHLPHTFVALPSIAQILSFPYHPAISPNPPIGATAPHFLFSLKVSAYKLPEKKTIPKVKARALHTPNDRGVARLEDFDSCCDENFVPNKLCRKACMTLMPCLMRYCWASPTATGAMAIASVCAI